MAFDAGELVATLRGNMTPLSRDLAKAKSDLQSTAAVADATGKTVEQAGTRAAAGSKRATAAAKEGAAAQREGAAASKEAASAATAAAAAQTRTTAAARQAAAATTEQAAAADAAGAAQVEAGAKGEAAGKRTAKASDGARERLESQRDAAQRLGVALTAYGAAATAGFALAIRASTEFGAKQAQLQSLSGANAADMQREADAAMTLGTAYGLTASQVADAEVELQKAGQGVTDQLSGGLKGALTLAAAGQMDVADATSIAVTTLTQFRLGADQTAHVADLLSAGSDKALGSVKDLGDGLKQGGLVASQMGLSVDDTVGTLSAFAQAGLIGSDAGTSFKTMLLSLQSPSTQAQKLLDRYNITAYDSQGAFVGITNLAGQLQSQLGGLSQQQRDAALSTIFGTDAIRSANVLYKEGSSGIQQWIRDVDDSGFAAEQAAGKQNSLAGDLQKLSAVIQTDLIRAGQALDPVMRPLVEGLVAAASAAGTLPAPLLAVAAGVTGVTGVVSLGTGALLLFLPKLLEMRTSLVFLRQEAALATYGTGKFATGARVATGAVGGLRAAGGTLSSFLGGPWGIALAAGTAALIAYQAAVDNAKASNDEVTASIMKTTDATQLLKLGAQGTGGPLQFIGLAVGDDEIVDHFSKSIADLGDQVANPKWRQGGSENQRVLNATVDALKNVDTSLATVASTNSQAAAASFESLAKRTDGTGSSLRALLGTLPGYEKALRASAIAAGLNVTSGSKAEQQNRLLAFALKEAGASGEKAGAGAKVGADGTTQLGQSAEDAKKHVDDLKAAIDGIDGGTLGARAAERDFQQAIDDVTKSIKDNGRTLDEHTEKGRANQATLDAIADKAKEVAKARLDEGKATKESIAALDRGRASYVAAAEKMGMLSGDAKALADSIFGIPASRATRFDGDTRPAKAQISDLYKRLRDLGASKTVAKIDASKQGLDAKLHDARVALQKLEDERHQVFIDAIFKPAAVPNTAPAAIRKPGGIAGGAIPEGLAFRQGGRIPGVDRGDDNVEMVGRSGEHMLTVKDVEAMGGHPAVYAFRRELHGYAKGGAIGDASSKAGKANAQAEKIRLLVERQKRVVKDANAAVRKAQKDVDAASDASANVYGKGTGARKHAAVLDARDARKRLDAATKAAKDAEEKLERLRADRSKQQDIAKTQTDRNLSLSETREDLDVANSRGQYVDADNPTGVVDYLQQQSRNQDLSKTDQKRLRDLAKEQNARLVQLGKDADVAADGVDRASKSLTDAQDASDKAAGSLQSLRDQFASTVSSVASNVRSLFSLSNAVRDDEVKTTSLTHNAGTGAEWAEAVTTTVAGGATVASIRSEIDQSNASINGFADMLQQLAGRGFSSDVITDVANQGVEKGSQLAAALLTATDDDRNAINAGYSSIAAGSTRAGTVVAQGQFGAQIDAAQGAADAAARGVVIAQQQLDQAKAAQAAVAASITSAQTAIVQAIQSTLGTSKRAYGGIHQPQIQPAGRNVLWAEGDTGGEAYIPFAMDRRPRALAILDETARRLGRVVVPAGGQAFAMGGILEGTGSSTSYGGDVHNWNGPIMGSPDEILAAAERRAKLKRARTNRSAGIGGVQP